MAYIRRRGCKCPKDAKRCTCGAKWSFTIDIGTDPVTGKRKQLTKSGFDTRRDAELAAIRAEAEVASGTFVRETRATFEEYAQLWLKQYQMSGAKKSSIRQRDYQIRSLLRYFGKKELSKITRKNYREAILDMSSKMARNTVFGIHTTAKCIFKLAVEDGDLKDDPTRYVRIPEAKEEEESLPKYMEKEQLAEFLRLAKTRGMEQDFLVFLVLAYTGMRVGELCVLRWSDIDFENNTISINGTLYNPLDLKDHYEILPPKTKQSRRTIDVDPWVMEELKKHKAIQNEFRMKHRKTYHDADFVFARMDTPRNSPPQFGYPMPRRMVERRMSRLVKMMNPPAQFTPHSLRHTHTSLLAEAGVSLEAIMERLGHKNDHTTRLIYLHVTKQMKREASEKFSALMSNVVKL
jgi:integrase